MGVQPRALSQNIIITIMAERDINDDAALGEMLHVTDIVLQGETVLDAEHDALSALPLIAIKIGGRVRAMLRYWLFLLTISSILSKMRSAYCAGPFTSKATLLLKLSAYLRLWQVSYHRGSILMTIGHLMESTRMRESRDDQT